MSRVSLVVLLALASGCVTSSIPVSRRMLGPLPAQPLTTFDEGHGALVAVEGESHPLPLHPGAAQSGLGVPVAQVNGLVMVRLNPRLALGGALEFGLPQGARFPSTTDVRFTDPSFTMKVGVQGTIVDTAVFGLDVAGQLAVHLLPMKESQLSPLSSTPLNSDVMALPGVAFAVLPKLRAGPGTLFGGVSLATNVDIAASGNRQTLTSNDINDDTGHLSATPTVMAGLGYALSTASGAGVRVQAWVPLTSAVGYSLLVSVALEYGFGPAPRFRPRVRRQSEPQPMPAPDVSAPPLVDAPPPTAL